MGDRPARSEERARHPAFHTATAPATLLSVTPGRAPPRSPGPEPTKRQLPWASQQIRGRFRSGRLGGPNCCSETTTRSHISHQRSSPCSPSGAARNDVSRGQHPTAIREASPLLEQPRRSTNVCLTSGVKLRGPEGAQRLRATSAATSELCGTASATHRSFSRCVSGIVSRLRGRCQALKRHPCRA
jgi:hypothetical protein